MWLLGTGMCAVVACGVGPRPAAHQVPAEDRPAACLEEEESNRYLLKQVGLLGGHGRSQALEVTCDKRIYQHGSHRIAVFREPRSPDGVRSISVERLPGAPPPSRRCFERATDYLRQHLPYGARLISSARRHYAERWFDPDTGPRAFLHCSGDQPVPSSVASMAHEINHALRSPSCSHEPTTAEHVCFQLPSTMPARSLARLPRSLLVGHSAHAPVHHSYMVAMGGQSPVTLFDEMVAYSLNADVQSRLLVTRAAAGHPLRSRPHMWLPMFMYLSLRYVQMLEAHYPDVYRVAFGGDGSANRRALHRLLAGAEQSMARWLDAIDSVGTQPFASETLFWTLYLELRPQVLPNWPRSVVADHGLEAADQ